MGEWLENYFPFLLCVIVQNADSVYKPLMFK